MLNLLFSPPQAYSKHCVDLEGKQLKLVCHENGEDVVIDVEKETQNSGFAINSLKETKKTTSRHVQKKAGQKGLQQVWRVVG